MAHEQCVEIVRVNMGAYISRTSCQDNGVALFKLEERKGMGVSFRGFLFIVNLCKKGNENHAEKVFVAILLETGPGRLRRSREIYLTQSLVRLLAKT